MAAVYKVYSITGTVEFSVALRAEEFETKCLTNLVKIWPKTFHSNFIPLTT